MTPAGLRGLTPTRLALYLITRLPPVYLALPLPVDAFRIIPHYNLQEKVLRSLRVSRSTTGWQQAPLVDRHALPSAPLNRQQRLAAKLVPWPGRSKRLKKGVSRGVICQMPACQAVHVFSCHPLLPRLSARRHSSLEAISKLHSHRCAWHRH